jgi:hypothetical protein
MLGGRKIEIFLKMQQNNGMIFTKIITSKCRNLAMFFF